MSAKAILSASVSAPPAVYVEDVFSTFLYAGNGSTQTITNGIDLSGEGGLVWVQARSAANASVLADTARGAGIELATQSSNGESVNNKITAFGSTGFTVDGSVYTGVNSSSVTYASWTFRKAEKFFDVVTYTGNGTAGRTVAHNLGSVPGMIIVKKTSGTGNWAVYHRALGFNNALFLHTTGAAFSSPYWNSTAPTASAFTLNNGGDVNASGATYVAYLFAHDAGGFGDSGDESVVKCGSFTTDGVGKQTIDLGWEPQWILVKSSGSTGDWQIIDNMRGWPMFPENTTVLRANLSNAETTNTTVGNPTATGFIFYGPLNNAPYIYIAIRRGPMKTPTVATEVFALNEGTGSTSGQSVTTNFPVDMDMTSNRTLGGVATVGDRMRGYGNTDTAGATPTLTTSSTGAEATGSNPNFYKAWNTTITRGSNGGDPGGGKISWFFRRAPGFFDVVAYTGTGTTLTVNHNLGVAPELMIVKSRSTGSWNVYSAFTGATQFSNLNGTIAATVSNARWNNTAPTSTVFTVGFYLSASGATHIAYLFATAPGVSKVGNYTGTGTTKQIDCGFTAGARFVLIKRTDSTGDWYTYDTARGIISGNDPYLLLNSSAAEVTGTDYIDPLSSGFEISSTAPAAINANGGTYIFLAIA